jgi:hypothetical protein
VALVLTDAVIAADGLDLSADSNSVSLELTVNDLDVTTFASEGTTERAPGLSDWSLSAEGFYRAASDAELSETVGAHAVYTVAPDNTDGGAAYCGRALATAHQVIGGSVGEVASYSLSASGSMRPPMARGTIALPRASYTADATGSNFNLGALTSGQRLYAFVHVLGAPGGTSPTLAVTVQSDDSAGFTDPTDRLVMSGLTPGASVGTVTGPVTDAHWRVVADLGGTSPVYALLVSLVRSL